MHQDRVYNLAYRLTGNRDLAWDLSQEAFMKAWAGIKSFRGGCGFYTWIYRIALNLHMNREKSLGRRMEKRTLSIDKERGENPRSTLREVIGTGKDSEPSSAMEQKEREAAVQQAILELDGAQRQVVLLRDMEGFSYEEIADLLDLPLGTVRSRLHRAREELKRRLEKVL